MTREERTAFIQAASAVLAAEEHFEFAKQQAAAKGQPPPSPNATMEAVGQRLAEVLINLCRKYPKVSKYRFRSRLFGLTLLDGQAKAIEVTHEESIESVADVGDEKRIITNPVFYNYWSSRLYLSGVYLAIAETTQNDELASVARKLAGTSYGANTHADLAHECQALVPEQVETGIQASLNDALMRFERAIKALVAYSEAETDPR